MNVAFNYIKFASYSAVPFVVVFTLNVAVIYRTLRVSPHLRRTFGGELLTLDRHASVSVPRTAVVATSLSSRSGSWHQPASSASISLPSNSAVSSITASQVSGADQRFINTHTLVSK